MLLYVVILIFHIVLLQLQSGDDIEILPNLSTCIHNSYESIPKIYLYTWKVIYDDYMCDIMYLYTLGGWCCIERFTWEVSKYRTSEFVMDWWRRFDYRFRIMQVSYQTLHMCLLITMYCQPEVNLKRLIKK